MHSFSIIVVSYNTKKNFIKTLNSIKKQTYKKYEIIVIDGFSTDGTAALIRKNKNKKIRFLIEKDSGIYDAMNKGIKKIKNEWTLFLNSGDVFKDNRVLKRVNNNIDKKDDIVFGNTIINNTGLFYYNLSNFFNNLTLQMPFCHQSVFTRTELLKKNWNTPKWKTYWLYIQYRQIIRFEPSLTIHFDFYKKILEGTPELMPSKIYPIFILSLSFNIWV